MCKMNTKNRDQYKRVLRILADFVILFLESLVFSAVWQRYYAQKLWLEPFYFWGDIFIVVVYAAYELLFMYIYGALKIGYLKGSNVIYSQALSGMCANVVMYVQILLLWRHLPDPRPLIVMTVIDILIAAVCAFLFDRMFARLFPPRQLLLIYDEYPVEKLCQKMDSRRDKFCIAKQISVAQGEEAVLQAIEEWGREGVVLGDLHSEMRNRLLKYCYSRSIRVYLTPKVSDIILKASETLDLFDTPLFLARNYGLTVEQRIAKRCLDVTVSALLLLVASPFMLIVAAAIHFYDKGPVFFRQKRLTKDGKVFDVYKFRSMIVDAEKDGVARLAGANDSRITPVGKVIRATRLDELPQLLNILKGDMSLVGPRPERPEIASQYEKEIPEFAYRLKVKAGLTGYAQIYGKYNTTAYDKLKLDLMYIENYSILNDLKLIVATFKILFMKESTEGMEEGQTISRTERSKTMESKNEGREVR